MIRIFEVGGCVRDEILGVPSNDVDFAMEAPSFQAMKDYMESKNFKIFLETPEFFTIRARFPTNNLVADFVLCRKESGYSNNRHPDLVEPGTIYDDLSRRDFTINAIAKSLESGEFLDPHNGIEDLKNRILRTVGDPRDRFNEDSLRILRALRFSITKSLVIDPSIWQALKYFNPEILASVSTERKREELTKMFKADSLASIRLINKLPDGLQSAIFENNLWLKATLEK